MQLSWKQSGKLVTSWGCHHCPDLLHEREGSICIVLKPFDL